ncbi:MAG: hypothetical protein Q8O00_13230 [Holophaga sp.]|nr:hypothetical protein [Holophaga sp.]
MDPIVKRRIVFVDDQPMVLQGLQRMLQLRAAMRAKRRPESPRARPSPLRAEGAGADAHESG